MTTVDRILDAALEQFLLVGIRRTTVGDVAARAGLTPVTIYRRVGQREALVNATLARETERVLARITAAMAPYDAVEDRIVETFVVVVRDLIQHPLFVRLGELEPETLMLPLTRDAAPLIAMGEAHVAGEILAAKARGQADIEHPAALAAVLVRYMHSILLCPPPGILDDEDRARAMAREIVVPLVAGAR